MQQVSRMRYVHVCTRSCSHEAVRQELQKPQARFESDLAVAKGLQAPASPAPPAAAAPAGPQAEATETRVEASASLPWTEITMFSLDLGDGDKPFVTVDVRLRGVEALPSTDITCDFTDSSFDLKVVGLEGKNYRFRRTNLENRIIPAGSVFKVKKNHVMVWLQKAKNQFDRYDIWLDLCGKGRPKSAEDDAAEPKTGPNDGILDMMKELYETGDDTTRKIIEHGMYLVSVTLLIMLVTFLKPVASDFPLCCAKAPGEPGRKGSAGAGRSRDSDHIGRFKAD